MVHARLRVPSITAPRASYRLGLALAHRGELRALQVLSVAMEGMQARGDAAGAALAAALLVTSQSMQIYRGFAERSEALRGLRDGSIVYPDHDDALIAHAGLLCGLCSCGRTTRSSTRASPRSWRCSTSTSTSTPSSRQPGS